jgi:hypothetical protein
LRRFFRRIGRAIAWPARRFFDPRFQGVIDTVEAGAERTEFVGRSVELLGRSLDDVHRLVQRTYGEAERASELLFERLMHAPPADLDVRTAALLERETGTGGFAGQAGMLFDPAVRVGYEEGGVVVRGVSGRIVEVPYVFRGLGGVASGSAVLYVGASDGTVALALASLGYDVTAFDQRPRRLAHPRLRSLPGSVEEWERDRTFAAVVCLASSEPDSSDDRTDGARMQKLLELTDPSGLLLLTIRFGSAGPAFDRAELEALLGRWRLEDLTLARRLDAVTWTPAEASEGHEELVALVSARR